MLDRDNNLNAWDRDHFFHPSTHMGGHARGETPRRVMAGGEGCEDECSKAGWLGGRVEEGEWRIE